jgi:hypothetical protein
MMTSCEPPHRSAAHSQNPLSKLGGDSGQEAWAGWPANYLCGMHETASTAPLPRLLSVKSPMYVSPPHPSQAHREIRGPQVGLPIRGACFLLGGALQRCGEQHQAIVHNGVYKPAASKVCKIIHSKQAVALSKLKGVLRAHMPGTSWVSSLSKRRVVQIPYLIHGNRSHC